MSTPSRSKIDTKPLSNQELKKHIDPILSKNLLKIHVDNVTRVRVTAAFWDISGFSDLCKVLNNYPVDLNELLKKYFALGVDIISKHNGVLDKFIGDGIFAYFGYDGETRTGIGDPLNAIKAAVEFKEKFVDLKQRFIADCKKNDGKDVSKINLKCGMDNGVAFIHYYNTPKRNSIIIFGSTVNYASRLSEFAKNDEIVISEVLKNMVDDKVECHSLEITERELEGIQSFEDEKVVFILKSVNCEAPGIKRESSITLLDIPDKVFIGKSFDIKAEFFGTVKYGVLTMVIRDSVGKEAWLADPETFERNTQIGTLFLNNQLYKSQYVDTVLHEHSLQKGKATATMLMYTNTNDRTKMKPIASMSKDITLT